MGLGFRAKRNLQVSVIEGPHFGGFHLGRDVGSEEIQRCCMMLADKLNSQAGNTKFALLWNPTEITKPNKTCDLFWVQESQH